MLLYGCTLLDALFLRIIRIIVTDTVIVIHSAFHGQRDALARKELDIVNVTLKANDSVSRAYAQTDKKGPLTYAGIAKARYLLKAVFW
jgi:hypothetical protein